MATILEEYIARHPGSAQRYAEAVQIFPSGVTHDARYLRPYPIYVQRAQGSRKWDVDGNEFLEYGAGLRSVGLGHAFAPVVEAVIYLGWGEATRPI